MNVRDELEAKLKQLEVEHSLSLPDVLADSSKMAAVAREHGSLAKLPTRFGPTRSSPSDITGLAEMADSDDPDEREMAEDELTSLRGRREELWNELLEMTVGGEDANRSRCVMEIRAGTGGEEAALFARDLYEMYRRHAEARSWKVEVMDMSVSERGGFKEIVFGIEGEGVYRELQFESGGHRVQRVPETETQGRVHTSAATVAVLAEPEDVEVELKKEDYRIDKFCASGPGGQHVNKTESAIRLTHFDTGIVVQCQDEKSQLKNLAKALRVLKSRIYDFRRQQQLQKQADTRKSLIGSGDRSQRIRTYNFPQNRLTDHRINLTLYKLDQVMAGDLSPVTKRCTGIRARSVARGHGV